MKIISLINGTTSIAICPENEMDIMILKEIAKGEVSIHTYDKLQLMDKSVNNVLMITPKKEENNLKSV